MELAQLNRAPIRQIRYLPELDMEIEIIERPKKAIVNEDIRVRALREHWDEKELRALYRHPSGHKRSNVSLPSCVVATVIAHLHSVLTPCRIMECSPGDITPSHRTYLGDEARALSRREKLLGSVARYRL